MVSKVSNRVSLIVGFLLCFALGSEAKVKLPMLVADGMVLQRNQPVSVWGWADAGETVQVTFQKKSYTTVADAGGNWQVTLPAHKPGGPYTMNINDIQLNNILIGDVFFCSGQSNMELPVSRVLDLYRAEAEADSNPLIRLIRIPLTYNFHAPQADVPATSWQELTPKQAMAFSAVAYFFAKDLFAKTHVPVGIINSSVGGSPVEAWMSEDALQEFPKYFNEKQLYECDAYIEQVKKVERARQQIWNNVLYRGDAGLHESTPWYAANYDDSSWKIVTLFDTFRGNGSHWFRKDMELTAAQADEPATLRLGCMVDADSVYVNGTFVGTIAYQYPPRIYSVPAHLLKAGKNTITIRLISYGGTPSFVPEKPYKLIIGTNEINLEGEWKYKPGCPMVAAGGQTFFQYKPEGLYNAMIAPLRRYTVCGAVWYQGESNVGRHHEYAALLTGMIRDWRTAFNQPGLPFYIIELAGFLHPSDVQGQAAWAALRTAQAQVAATNRRVTLIQNSDLGEWNDIHPLGKKPLGIRLSQAVWSNMNSK